MNIRKYHFAFASLITVSLWTCAIAQSSGFDTSRMDRSASACNDFFQFANGTWVKNTEIPASQSRWGSFNILAESNREVLRGILERAAKKKARAGTDTQMLGDFYSSCMNEALVERAGTKPIAPYLASIDEIKTTDDLVHQIALLHQMSVPAAFRFSGGQDLKDTNMVIVNAGQGGLSLPNRDYYTKDDARSVETRTKFIEYMTNMFKLLGEEPNMAAGNALAVMTIQTRLAKASRSPVEMRDPDKNYNKTSLAEFQKMTPRFSWAAYMKTRAVPAVDSINVGQPNFFKELNSMLKDVPIAWWKIYLKWMLLNNAAPALPKAFVDENFNFQGKYLSGTKEQLPRWKKCVQATDNNLGEALGMEFVKTHFTPKAKARMNELIDNLFVAMRSHIEDLKWMGPETKQKALAKLATYKRKIGYPDKLRGYKGLAIDRKSYLANVFRSAGFQVGRNIADIGKPADRTRWGWSPPTVNASYSSLNNEITFPAGILQPPFFNFKADDAINYGAIGGVIGHEITHGFDDQGSKFGADGNLNMWWTKKDREEFEKRASCVVDQFSAYEVQPGLNMSGKLTLGENIGDFGGLTIAYDAFMRFLEGKPRPADIDGFTPEQRFFLGWAQVWAAKATLEAERLQVQGDPHALPRWRVNGPMSNMPEFQRAWGCKTGDKMVREKFCEIW